MYGHLPSKSIIISHFLTRMVQTPVQEAAPDDWLLPALATVRSITVPPVLGHDIPKRPGMAALVPGLVLPMLGNRTPSSEAVMGYSSTKRSIRAGIAESPKTGLILPRRFPVLTVV